MQVLNQPEGVYFHKNYLLAVNYYTYYMSTY